MTAPPPRLRIDKWLWHARFFKTRVLAAEVAGAGRVRVNGNRVTKPAYAVGPGDVLTFAQGDQVRVVRVEAIGLRRGPASEARTLYTDLDQGRDGCSGET
ncbi:heat shock protein Hsp15 [Ruegeria marina]|uniref:Heat shock protein Hsp15 n=1 Tax=Ruegeria marina TaxID=639004 RepID=A0A1G6Z1R0_9RHOB|nr:heat shock protein Hsp15 [Ruegeria marina]